LLLDALARILITTIKTDVQAKRQGSAFMDRDTVQLSPATTCVSSDS
jgi:hypothetical protein